MTIYGGNQVAYGAGSYFQVIVEVTDNGSNTGTSTTVNYRYGVRFLYSISDSSNAVSWTDYWGSGNANNYNFSSGGGDIWVGGWYSNSAPIQYGGGNSIHFHMQASGLAGVSGTSSLDFDYGLPARTPRAPDTPGFVGQSALSSTSIRLQWSAPNNNGSAIDVYNLRVWTSGYSFDNPNVYNDGNTTTGTSKDVTGLTRNTTYFWGVDAHNAYGWGNRLLSGPVTTLATKPDKPSNPSASLITPTSARVSMILPNNGGATISDTIFELWSASSGGSKLFWDPSGGAITSYDFTGLTPATDYWMQVAAVNSVGTSDYSNRVKFTTLPSMKIKVDDVIKDAIPYAKVNGVIKQVRGYYNVDGVIKS